MSRLIRIFAVATVLNAGLLGQVLAHAHLESAVPAENAIVKVSPVEIDLTFSEGLNLKFSGATITGPGKATVSTGQAKLSINDHKTLVIPLSAPLASGGIYRELDRTFHRRSQDQGQLYIHRQTLMGLETTLVLCRFVHNASTMFLWGAFAYLALLVPKPLALEIGERLRPASVIAVFLAIGTIFAALPLQAGMIGQGWSDAVDLGTIRDVLFETSVGRGWAIQVAAALLLLPALALSPRRAHIALAMASGLLLASLAFSGHATMRESWIGAAHRFNDMVHVLSGGAWIGALIPVMLILGRLRQAEWRVAAQTALMRFSSVGHAAVALVIASGVVNPRSSFDVCRLIGHPPIRPCWR